MAASAVIGALRVTLGLNSASFRSGLDQSENRLSRFGATAKMVFAAVATAAVAVAGGLGMVVRNAADTADNMGEMAEKVGLSVETLTRLGHGAKMSGSDIDTLSTGIKKLSQNMMKAATGGPMAGMFNSLGVSVKDAQGNLRAADDVLMDLADRFAGMQDGAGKTALAIQLFGKAGAELVPFLNRGRDGIAELSAEADRLGVTISSVAADHGGAFNDMLDRVSGTLQGMSIKLMSAVTPALTALGNRFVGLVTEGASFDGVLAGLSAAMNILARGIILVFNHLGDLYDLFKVWVAARIVLFVTSLAGSMITLAKTVRTAGIAMAIVSSITKVKITAIVLLAAAIAKLTGTYETLVGWVEEFGNTVMASLPDSIKQGLDDLSSGLTGLGADIEAVDGAAAESLDAYNRGANTAADSFEAMGNTIKSAAAESNDALTETEEKAKTLAQRIGDAFAGIGQSIKGLISGTSSWQDVLMNVLETVARIGFQQINFGGVGNGDGSNGIMGDIVGGLLGGLFGFANGGSFKVGGTGGIDSQPVGFMASPDEVVSVMTPRQQREAEEYAESGGRSVTVNNTLNISTPDVRSFKQSEAQVSGRLAMMTRRGARTL